MYDFLNEINMTGFDDLTEFILSTLNLAVTIAALIAVIFLVYAGFQYITSKGEGEKAEAAQRSIIYTLIGLLLCFVAPLIMRFILSSVLQAS